MWDSKILHGYDQRFHREEYAEQLRKEIKEEISKSIDKDAKNRVSEQLQHNITSSTSTKTMSSLDHSALLLSNRKKREIQHGLDKGILGRQLELWNTETNTWKHCLTTGLRIEWNGGGEKATIQHKV